jgi:hypothetical protein
MGVKGLHYWQQGNIGNIDCIALLNTEVLAGEEGGKV